MARHRLRSPIRRAPVRRAVNPKKGRPQNDRRLATLSARRKEPLRARICGRVRGGPGLYRRYQAPGQMRPVPPHPQATPEALWVQRVQSWKQRMLLHL